MSSLPDLDTDNISYVAYWNAIDDGGVGSIDPEDVLGYGNIVEYTLYDNGIEMDYSSPSGATISARIKTDGWMIAYVDAGTTFGEYNTPKSGPWDVVNWREFDSLEIDITNHNLERSINQLRGQLSNSGSMTYNAADVSLYNYQYPNATTTAIGAHRSTANDNSFGGISYTSATTLKAAYATAAIRTGNGEHGITAYCNFAGTEIAHSSFAYNDAGSEETWGTIDVLSQGLIPNSGTEYQLETYSQAGYQDRETGNVTGMIMAIYE